MEAKTIGILLMAYGTPASLDEVEDYYTHIRRGRKPAPEQVEDLIQRYKAIGGLSPLHQITRKQGEGLEENLNRAFKDKQFRVYLGMKHSNPFIADTVQQMKQDGIETAVGLVLAPHYSVMSIGSYIKAAEEAVGEQGMPAFLFVKDWHLHPLYIDALATRVEAALQSFEPEERNEVRVMFSAHSLPERILQMGDPYPDQIKETAQAVADKLGLNHWLTAWQSAGQTGDPWLGPDILDVIEDLHEQGHDKLISCPVGFVSDHLEVLYDIDIECQDVCRKRGVKLVRTASLNAEPDFLAALTDIVTQHVVGE